MVSVRNHGALGDGVTDDRAALQAVLDNHIGATIYGRSNTDAVPYGIYVVRDTLHIPIGTRIVGEAQPAILGSGSAFNDEQNPRPVVRVGREAECGELVICDLIFSTRGPAAGAVVVEWNVHESYQGSVAMFDSHIRIGGTTGTDLETETCPKDKQLHELPRASFLNLHITPSASGYFQNVWIWTADQ